MIKLKPTDPCFPSKKTDDAATMTPPDNDPNIRFFILIFLEKATFVRREETVLPSNENSVVTWIYGAKFFD